MRALWTAGTGMMALLLIPLSLVADRYGRERLMRYGLLGAALFSLLSAWAPDFFLLVLARAALGACIAGVPAAAMAYLGEELPVAQRARAMGLYIGANALGDGRRAGYAEYSSEKFPSVHRFLLFRAFFYTRRPQRRGRLEQRSCGPHHTGPADRTHRRRHHLE